MTWSIYQVLAQERAAQFRREAERDALIKEVLAVPRRMSRLYRWSLAAGRAARSIRIADSVRRPVAAGRNAEGCCESTCRSVAS